MNFDPYSVPHFDSPSNVFDLLEQTHPEYRGNANEWHDVDKETYSPSIRIACEIIIPGRAHGRFVIAKETPTDELILFTEQGKVLSFTASAEPSLTGNRFKLLVITVGPNDPDDPSRISIDQDAPGQRDLIALYYTTAQVSSEQTPVEESMVIYNVSEEKILYRYLYGKKREAISSLFQLASVWRSHAVNPTPPSLPIAPTDPIVTNQTEMPQDTSTTPVLASIVKQMEIQASLYQTSQTSFIREKVFFETKIQALETELRMRIIESESLRPKLAETERVLREYVTANASLKQQVAYEKEKKEEYRIVIESFQKTVESLERIISQQHQMVAVPQVYYPPAPTPPPPVAAAEQTIVKNESLPIPDTTSNNLPPTTDEDTWEKMSGEGPIQVGFAQAQALSADTPTSIPPDRSNEMQIQERIDTLTKKINRQLEEITNQGQVQPNESQRHATTIEELNDTKARLAVASEKLTSLREQLATERKHTHDYQKNFELSHQTIQESLKTEKEHVKLTQKLTDAPSDEDDSDMPLRNILQQKLAEKSSH